MWKITATIEGDIAIQDVYVIKGLHQALLGGPAIRVLNLLKKTNFVEAVYSSEVEAKLNEKWKNTSPQLFKGLAWKNQERSS